MAEDNLPDALLVREAIRLENLPLDLHIASDGAKAIDFIERAEQDPQAPCPQIVLLDLNLPRKDGFEVLRRLRTSERLRRTPVIVITSSDAPADRKKAAEWGAGYFRKPTDYDEFLRIGAVLKKVLQEKSLI